MPTLKDFADNFNQRQLNLKKAKAQQSYSENANLMDRLYESQTSSQDKTVATESGKAIRKTQAAYWIRDFYNNNYWDELNQLWINLDSMPDWKVIDWYTELNPDSYDLLMNYVLTETDINDPLSLYYSMWIMPNEDSISISNNIKRSINQITRWQIWEYFKDSLENTKEYWERFMESELSWPTEMYYWLRNFVNWVQWLRDNDANWFWALQNYAHEELGKDVSDLTDLEFYWITEALKNPEIYANYQPTPVKWWVETLAWFTDTLFTIAARPVKLLFSAAEADPIWQIPMSILWWTQEELMWRWLWGILTFPLEWYVQDMPEHDRKIWHAWLWSVLTLGLAFKAKNSGPRAWDLFRWILKDLWIEKVINWFENKVLRPLSPKEIGWGIENFEDSVMLEWLARTTYNNMTPEQQRALDLETNKVINSDTISENKDISRAFSQMDQKKLKEAGNDYEKIYNINENEIWPLLKMENTIAWTIEKKFGPKEDVWEWDDVTVSGKYKWNTEPNRPIREFFNMMRILARNESPNIRKALDAYEQKYLAWDVDVQDLLNFKRWLSKQYIKYKYKDTEGKEPVSDSDIRRIYDWLNYLIRDSISWNTEFNEAWLWNIMQTLDQRLSPHLHLRGRLLSLINEVNKELWKIPTDINSRKVWNTLKSIPNGSLYGLLKRVVDKLATSKEKLTSAIDLQEQLPKSIKKITNILKEFPDEQKQIITKSLADYLSRKLWGTKESYWGFAKWEVVEEPLFRDWEAEFSWNPFLEDKVEIVPKESNMIWENKWVGPDLQEPIRVTPEGFAWKWNANIEWYNEPYEWSIQAIWKAYNDAMDAAWFSEAQKDRVFTQLEKNNYKVKQQSLFWDSLTEEQPSTKSTYNLQTILDELKALEESAKKTAKPKKWKVPESKKAEAARSLNEDEQFKMFDYWVKKYWFEWTKNRAIQLWLKDSWDKYTSSK